MTDIILKPTTTNTIEIAKSVPIRAAGFDEFWLRDQIAANPICLGLGELDLLAKERQQSSGGRLDLLLKDPEDDAMFEVEIMLGETDETHIIRTIEYWDSEKRRWPQRQHFAVLVAETINRRFFNVIHLLSYSIPIIAIQVSCVQVGDKWGLFFTTVLDTYEEIDDGTSLDSGIYDRNYWLERAKWTVETADALQAAVAPVIGNSDLNYLKQYIAINVAGNNYMWLHRRTLNKSLLALRLTQAFQPQATSLLDAKNISHVQRPKSIRLTIDRSFVDQNAELLRDLAALVKQSWEKSA